MTGRIMKATGGFYYVSDGSKTVECRARGIFRKLETSPCVGDMVDAMLQPDGCSGTVDRIHPRKNALVRPPLANLDCMVVVVSSSDPEPNTLILDKFLAVLSHKDIPVILAVTKPDLANASPLAELYRGAGYPVFIVDNLTGAGAEALCEALAGKLCAFSGNSGVGKSSLLNAVAPGFALPVGDTSKKLGRGRHTTRHVELHTLENGAMIADTPGFSAIDLLQMSELRAEELAACFPEFGAYTPDCRFPDCRHDAERGCAVRAAVEAAYIAESRYRSYRALFAELKDVREWERK